MAIERDDGVGLVVVEHLKHGGRIGSSEFDRNIRVLLVEINIMGIDHLLAERVGRDDMDMPRAVLLLHEAFLKPIGQGTNLMGIGNQLATALGERDGMVNALEKETFQLVLELLDLKGDRRLRITELLGRARKATKLGNVNKRDKVS